MQRPFLQFYTADWRGDPRVRACSFAARGLWIEMMALMHEADPYGHLMIADRRITEKDAVDLAVHAGGKTAETRRLLAELKEKGVYSVADDGTIFSRRMVRDEERRAANYTNGLKGGVAWAPRDGLTRKEREARARALGTHTAAQWATLRGLCGERCVACGKPEYDLHGGIVCKDHILPISLGGSDHISNLQPVCRPCNTKRGDGCVDLRPEAAIAWSKSQPGYNPGVQPGIEPLRAIASPHAHDRDPDTRDQSTETAPPSGASARTHEDPLDDGDLPGIPAGDVRTGPAMQFATWFVRAALKAGAIPQHFALKAADIAYREFPHAEPLVVTYPPAELKARSKRLFARKLDATDPLRKSVSIATLSQHWDWFGEDPAAARATGGAVRPSGGGMPDINLETLG